MSAPDNNSRWIELGRAFVPCPESESEVELLTTLWARHRAVGWDDLLRRRCAVVLGERGTGKTVELKARVAALRAAGRFAFFLPVEDVFAHGVEQSIDATDLDAYDQWRSSTDNAWFFLDAVDESKLKEQRLSAALRRLTRELVRQRERIGVVLSSRASDWRPADDEEVAALRAWLSPASRDAENESERPFQLAPLTDEQVARLAAFNGVTDVDAFVGAIREAGAWSFVARPLDVEWLAGHWRSNRTLGTLTELIESNIVERLAEKVERRTTLTLAEARDAAARVALVATLTQRSGIRLPGTTRLEADDALDTTRTLPGLTNDGVRDLLSRALFDEATYGRVRIHHRAVQEYLAADYLRTLLDHGLPRGELEAVMFPRGSAVPRHLKAVAAWLASRDPGVRARVLALAPEHLIDEGDPSSLPMDVRRAALRAYATRFGDRDRVYHRFDQAGLRRFAASELADDIRALLDSDSEPEHVREVMLELVEAGRLAALADDALEIALASRSSARLRVRAIRAVAAAGTESDRIRLRSLAGAPECRDRDVAAALINAVYPGDAPPEFIMRVIRSVEAPRRRHMSALDVVLGRALVEQLSPGQRSDLLDALVEESSREAPPDGPAALRPPWVAELFLALLASVIASTPRGADGLEAALDLALPCVIDSDATDHWAGEVLRASPEVRRALFWHHVRRETERGRRPRRRWDVGHLEPIAPSVADREWLVRDAIEAPEVWHRLLAFDFVMAMREDGDGCVPLESIASQADGLHGGDSLGKHLARAKNPPGLPVRHRFELLRRTRELRERRQHERNQAALHGEITRIREGKHPNALHHLYGIGNTAGPLARYAGFSVDAVAAEYDREIASAAREGFKRYWRENEPVLLHEREERNRTPDACVFGMVGIGLDVEDGLDITALPEALLRRAAAYGLADQRLPDVVRDDCSPSSRCRDTGVRPRVGTRFRGNTCWREHNPGAAAAQVIPRGGRRRCCLRAEGARAAAWR